MKERPPTVNMREWQPLDSPSDSLGGSTMVVATGLRGQPPPLGLRQPEQGTGGGVGLHGACGYRPGMPSFAAHSLRSWLRMAGQLVMPTEAQQSTVL